jgi:sulfide:quinone oxidoreductase
MADIIILGAGTAGTIMANRLRRLFASDVRSGSTQITVVDQDARHVYQPGLLFLPFGWYDASQVAKSRARQLHPAVTYREAIVERVDAASNAVELANGDRISYDVLIIATGVRLAPEETEGLTGAGWRERTFDFYTVEGATALHEALRRFEHGRLVLNVVEMPIKCPVAPLEFCFLADWYFTQRGIREAVDITYVTPLDGAFTKPIASSALSHLLREKRINLVTEFNTGRVDGEQGTLYSWDEREVPFDLLVTIPLHLGASYVSHSQGLGDDGGFVRTDPRTLQARVAPNVFAVGDATDLPASKAGSVAHFESEVLTENVRRLLAGEPLDAGFDGHANCFIETGHAKALLLDFNYDQEPLPGTYPLPGIGPMRLLEESRVNHLGKLAFRWAYWNVLLPGHAIPGIGSRMTTRGKRRPRTPAMPETVQSRT